MTSPALLRDRPAHWRDRLPFYAEVVLWSLLLVQAIRLAALFMTPAPAAEAVATDASAPADARIPAVDLFYRQPRAAGGDGVALGYRLFGLRSGPDGASAVLGKGGKQASYAVGETIAPGVKLASVGTDHVWLTANGQRHRLSLPALDAGRPRSALAARALPSGAAAQRASPGSQGAGSGSAPAAVPKAIAAAPAPATGGASGAGISAEQLLDATGAAAAAGGLAAKLPGGRAALLRLAGLRADDVVLSVDGRPLDPSQLAALGRELAGRERVTVQYRRDGQVHTTTFDTPR